MILLQFTEKFETLLSLLLLSSFSLLLLFLCLVGVTQEGEWIIGIVFLLRRLTALIEEVILVSKTHHIVEFINIFILLEVLLLSNIVGLSSGSSLWDILISSSVSSCSWSLKATRCVISWRLLSWNTLVRDVRTASCGVCGSIVKIPIIIVSILLLVWHSRLRASLSRGRSVSVKLLSHWSRIVIYLSPIANRLLLCCWSLLNF